MTIYALTDMWVYDLSGNPITKQDTKKAHEMNLIMKRQGEEAYIVGSYNAVLSYLYDYIGIEPVDGYLFPLKDVL